MSTDEVRSLGGWSLVDCIGKGGMGEVWRAERMGAGGIRRRAALKRILRKFQADKSLTQRFIAEARTTARLDHPNVVRLLDFGDEPELFLVLEYIDGASLLDWLKLASRREAELPIEAVLFAIAEAANGLDFAHRCVDENGQPLGIVHRDVSPANIMVSSEGAVKVNDFGVARAADNAFRTEAGLAVGKLAYMAPEQARGEPVDRRADIFALGVCLWELLTLRPLLPRTSPGDTLLALSRCQFDPPSRYAQRVSPELDALVLQCLRAEKSERPSNAEALSRALRTALFRLSPGYTTLDFAQCFRAAIPRFAEQQRFEPPSAFMAPGAPAAQPARAPTPTPADGHTRASIPSAVSAHAQGHAPPSMPARAPTPADGLARPSMPAPMPVLTPGDGVMRPSYPVGAPSPVTALSAPGAPIMAAGWVSPASQPGGYASQLAPVPPPSGAYPPAPQPAAASVPTAPIAAAPAAAKSDTGLVRVVAIGLGSIFALLLVLGGGGLYFLRARDDDDDGPAARTSGGSAPSAPSGTAAPVTATAPQAPTVPTVPVYPTDPSYPGYPTGATAYPTATAMATPADEPGSMVISIEPLAPGANSAPLFPEWLLRRTAQVCAQEMGGQPHGTATMWPMPGGATLRLVIRGPAGEVNPRMMVCAQRVIGRLAVRMMAFNTTINVEY